MKRPPGGAVFKNRVEDGEQLAHAGYQRYHLRFAPGAQSLVELLDGWVEACGHQGSHVQNLPHALSSAPYRPTPAQRAGVSVERSDTHQGCQLLGIKFSTTQLGQLSARRVLARTGPTPGTLLSSSSFSRQMALARIVSSRSESVLSSSFSSHRMCASIRFLTGLLAVAPRRFFSAVIISTIWRLLARIAANSRASCSGIGLGSGRIASPKRARISASILSVLASLPVARAKSRAWRGFTTATGIPSAAKAAATGRSKPPVASSTTSAGHAAWSRPTRESMPAWSLVTSKRPPLGRKATSWRAL